MVLVNPLKTQTALRAGFGDKVLVLSRCERRRCRRDVVRGYDDRRPREKLVPYGSGALYSGQLSTARGAALADMPVKVIERFPAGASQPERVTTVRTDGDGVFVVNLLPGPEPPGHGGLRGDPDADRVRSRDRPAGGAKLPCGCRPPPRSRRSAGGRSSSAAGSRPEAPRSRPTASRCSSSSASPASPGPSSAPSRPTPAAASATPTASPTTTAAAFASSSAPSSRRRTSGPTSPPARGRSPSRALIKDGRPIAGAAGVKPGARGAQRRAESCSVARSTRSWAREVCSSIALRTRCSVSRRLRFASVVALRRAVAPRRSARFRERRSWVR